MQINVKASKCGKYAHVKKGSSETHTAGVNWSQLNSAPIIHPLPIPWQCFILQVFKLKPNGSEKSQHWIHWELSWGLPAQKKTKLPNSYTWSFKPYAYKYFVKEKKIINERSFVFLFSGLFSFVRQEYSLWYLNFFIVNLFN